MVQVLIQQYLQKQKMISFILKLDGDKLEIDKLTTDPNHLNYLNSAANKLETIKLHIVSVDLNKLADDEYKKFMKNSAFKINFKNRLIRK